MLIRVIVQRRHILNRRETIKADNVLLHTWWINNNNNNNNNNNKNNALFTSYTSVQGQG
jgi:hypothetical protein